MIWLLPGVAEAGSNVPDDAFVIPVPLQVPPGISAVRLNAATLAHCAATAVMFGGVLGVTAMFSTSVSAQGPVPTMYVTGMLPDNPAGSNVLPVTPVPLHVPPAVPVTNVFRLIAASSTHIGEGCVHAAFEDGATCI